MSISGPLAPVPQMLKTVLTWTVGGDTTVFNILHFKYSGAAPAPADLNTWCASVFNAAVTDFIPQCTSTTALTAVTATDLTSASGAEGTHAGSSAGTQGGSPLPASSCVLCSWTIGRRYRGGHPRTYFPLGTQEHIGTQQTWNSGAVTQFSSAIASWRNTVLGLTVGTATIANQYNVGYYSGFKAITDPVTGRVTNKPERQVPPNEDIITSFVVRPGIGSQRRRLLTTH